MPQESQKEQKAPQHQKNIPNGKIENEPKHKLNPSCLNTCIKWHLQATVSQKETKTSEFSGQSLYFKKLEASILNILQNIKEYSKIIAYFCRGFPALSEYEI